MNNKYNNAFTKNELVQLKLALGPLYNFQQSNRDCLEINSPFVNHIGDNYQVFVSKISNLKTPYLVDDDGDALNEFRLLEVSDQKARDYINNRKLVILDDMIQETCDNDHLLDAILLNLSIQMSLNALE